jgi:AraC-like DNA-binding protein/quercetin dioxygenase-like cupin family protein
MSIDIAKGTTAIKSGQTASNSRPAPRDAGRFRPQLLDRPLVAFAHDMADGEVVPWHQHDYGQLFYGGSGLMRVESTAGLWVVPPARGVWIPAGIDHQITAVGEVALRAVYLAAAVGDRLPASCCVHGFSPLLRELMAVAVQLPPDYPLDGPEARLVDVLIDQLQTEPEEHLHLPMPHDRRLRAVTEALIADPADPRTLADFAGAAGASARTLARRFLAETGLTFGAWRQQLRLHEALARLSQGEPVTTVAFEIGYESPSAFIAMFRKTLGATPGQYLSRS